MAAKRSTPAWFSRAIRSALAFGAAAPLWIASSPAPVRGDRPFEPVTCEAPISVCEAPWGRPAPHCPAGYECVPAPDPMCGERLAYVAETVARWVQRATRCRQDSDCVRLDTSTGCLRTCGVFVNARAIPRLERRLDRLDVRICDDYLADGCPPVAPLCLPTHGECVERRCVTVPEFPIPLD
jgi:hypothetical protein